MDFFYIIKVLWRKKWLLISVPVATFVLSYILTSNLPKEYVSEAQLSTGFTSGESVYQENAFSSNDATVKFANVIQTMNSPLIINLISYNLLMEKLSEKSPFTELDKDEIENLKEYNFNFTNKDIEQLKSTLQSKLDNFELINGYEKKDKVIQELLKYFEYDYQSIFDALDIYRLGSSDYIEIKYVSDDPFLSAFVVNTLAKEFIEYYNNLQSNNNNNSLQYYTKLLEEKKKHLDSKNQELNNLKSRNNIFNNGVSETKLEQIKEYELRVENYKENINSYRIQLEVIDNKLKNTRVPTSDKSNKRIIELKNKINELSKLKLNQENENPEIDKTIRDLRKELTYEMSKLSLDNDNDTQDQINNLRDQKENLELQLRIAENNLASAQTSLSSLKANVSGLASKESLIAATEKEADKAMEEYLQVLNQYNEEKNKSFITNSSISLLVPGQPSDEPNSSKRIIIVAIATLSSLLLLVFLLTFIEYIDLRIKTPEMFNRAIKLNLLGSINKINKQNINLFTLFEQPKNKELETFKEQLRKVRFEVERHTDENNVILITSNKKSEGKTFLVLSLAYSLNLLKKKVLIIDTNFKNNELTKVLMPNVQSNHQLLDFKTKLLTDSSLTKTDFQSESIISGTSHKNIDLIGSISLPESPSEIFSDKNFKELISSLSAQYDYIFLEGASLNEFSDSKELIDYADKVIAVFSAESTITHKDRESISYLKSLNGKFIGSVLNKVDIKDLEI